MIFLIWFSLLSWIDSSWSKTLPAHVILEERSDEESRSWQTAPANSKNEMLHFVQHDIKVRASLCRGCAYFINGVVKRFITGISRFARNDISRVRPELNLRAQSKRVRSTLCVSPKGFCYEPVNLLTGGHGEQG